MLIPKIQIQLQQLTQFKGYPLRNKVFIFNHVNDFIVNNDFYELMSPGTIIMPHARLLGKEFTLTEALLQELNSNDPVKRLKLKKNKLDKQKSFNVTEKYKNLANPKGVGLDGKTKISPVFAVGDIIRVSMAYINPITNDVLNDKGILKEDFFYFDYVITQLDLNFTLEIKIDNFAWFLKQAPMPNITIPKDTDIVGAVEQVIDISNEKLKGKIFPINVFSDDAENISFNDKLIVVGNMTIAQFLSMLKEKYNLISFMSNTTLVIGMSFGFFTTEYYRQISELIKPTKKSDLYKIFKFRRNIISSNLSYKDKESLKLSAIVSNTFETKTGETTKDGFAKTKKRKISVYLSIKGSEIDQNQQIIEPKVTILYNNNGVKVGEPPSVLNETEDGERRTLTFPNAKTTNDLIRLGGQELLKHYYTGFIGDFETFGEPLTFPGFIIRIEDDEFPERNGNYRVKAVERSFGLNGYRQRITLDIKIPE
jgi:hypothetical protein